jgi:hypothetical protein
MKPNQSLAAKAFAIGLTPIIPLPFLDELVRTWLLRRGIRQVAAEHGVTLADKALKRLASDRGGCLIGCLIGVVWWPIRKLFRTMFYFLTIKECLDTMAEGAVRIEMVRRAGETGVLPDKVELVREAMFQTLKADMGSPVTGIFRHKGAPGDIALGEDWSVRCVYWLVDASGGAATCDAFSERLAALTSAEE